MIAASVVLPVVGINGGDRIGIGGCTQFQKLAATAVGAPRAIGGGCCTLHEKQLMAAVVMRPDM